MLTWTQRQKPEHTHRVRDERETYFATAPRGTRLATVARAFATGYDHGESTGVVVATVTRLRDGAEIVHRFSPAK